VQGLVIHPRVRDVEVEEGRHQIQPPHHGQGHFHHRIDGGVDKGEIKTQEHPGDRWLDQGAPQYRAQNNGPYGQALDPAIGQDQEPVGQVFGEDAVFGRGIGRGAQAHHPVSHQGMDMEKHQGTARHLHRIGDEHHPPLGHGIRKGPHKGRQQHVGNGEKELEQRVVGVRRLHFPEGVDGGDEQGIVGERGEKLRRHDDVKAKLHAVGDWGRKRAGKAPGRPVL